MVCSAEQVFPEDEQKNNSSPVATPEDERLTRGTTSIQYAETHTLIQARSCLIAITDASGDAYLADAVQHAALGRNSEVLRCRLSPCPARCEGRMIRTGSRSLHLPKIYYSVFLLSSIFLRGTVRGRNRARRGGSGLWGIREPHAPAPPGSVPPYVRLFETCLTGRIPAGLRPEARFRSSGRNCICLPTAVTSLLPCFCG